MKVKVKGLQLRDVVEKMKQGIPDNKYGKHEKYT
jgi:hypothetical protein